MANGGGHRLLRLNLFDIHFISLNQPGVLAAAEGTHPALGYGVIVPAAAIAVSDGVDRLEPQLCPGHQLRPGHSPLDFFRHFSAELELLKINFGEFVELSGDKISVNETGILLIRNIAMCFDEYMVRHSNNAQSFSKTL